MTNTAHHLPAICFLLFTLPVFGAESVARSDPALDSLVGIWVSDTRFGPPLEGELTVRREGQSWLAALAGAESKFQMADRAINFSFGEAGKFRGTLAADQAAIEGFWLRPALVNAERPNPVGARQPFATPLTLKRTAPNQWRGNVRPLEDRFTLYLRIFRTADGSFIGAFRNPQINSRGGAPQFAMVRDGDIVRFSARPYENMPEIVHEARLSSKPARLKLRWQDVGRDIELVHRTPNEAASFFPRPLAESKYAYRKPDATNDGWSTARASEVGMDEATLTRLIQRLIDADPAERRAALIHSLLVARRGKLVLDEYFFGFDRDTPHDTRSAGKTFASVMLGAAMLQGAKLTPDTRVYELLADMGPFANPDPRKRDITLAHLLTHTAGLACDDNDDNSTGNEGTMQAQRRQPDWWKYTLDLPMAHDPGVRYAYCSANINLGGAALTKGTATWLPELFHRTVALPLQFGEYHWNLMPTDEGYQGGGAHVRPRDLLKVGQAYLDGGVWQGRRIVDASWVAASTTPRVKISPHSTGLDAERFAESYVESVDALAWHTFDLKAGQRTYREYEASGNGGQLLIVVPELELVVVFTAGNYMQGGIWGRFRDQIVPNEIIAAIREPMP